MVESKKNRKVLSSNFFLEVEIPIKCPYLESTGTLYQATRTKTNEAHFAHILSKKAYPDDLKSLLKTEFDNISKINSSDITKMLEFVDSTRNYIFVIEGTDFAEGQSKSLYELEKPFTNTDIMAIIFTIIRVMRIIQKHELYHLGLSPSAVLCVKGKFKVCMWINKLRLKRMNPSLKFDKLDNKDDIIFTAPELVESPTNKGDIKYDKSDVWSFAYLILWVLSSGEVTEYLKVHNQINPAYLKKTINSSKDWKPYLEFFLKSLVNDPNNRATVEESLTEIERILKLNPNPVGDKPLNQAPAESPAKPLLQTNLDPEKKDSKKTMTTAPEKIQPKEADSDPSQVIIDNISKVGTQPKIKSNEEKDVTEKSKPILVYRGANQRKRKDEEPRIIQESEKEDSFPKKLFRFQSPELIPYPPTKVGYELQMPRSEYIGNKSLIETDFLPGEIQKQTQLRNVYFLLYSTVEMLWGQCDELEEELDTPDFSAEILKLMKMVIIFTYLFIHLFLELVLKHFCDEKNIFGLDDDCFEAFKECTDFHCVNGIQFLHLYADNTTFIEDKFKIFKEEIKKIKDYLKPDRKICENLNNFSQHEINTSLKENAKKLEKELRDEKSKTKSSLILQKLNRTILRVNICQHAYELLFPTKPMSKGEYLEYKPGHMFKYSEVLVYWHYYKMLEEYEFDKTEDHLTKLNKIDDYFN